jgi:hypothetical protein
VRMRERHIALVLLALLAGSLVAVALWILSVGPIILFRLKVGQETVDKVEIVREDSRDGVILFCTVYRTTNPRNVAEWVEVLVRESETEKGSWGSDLWVGLGSPYTLRLCANGRTVAELPFVDQKSFIIKNPSPFGSGDMLVLNKKLGRMVYRLGGSALGSRDAATTKSAGRPVR